MPVVNVNTVEFYVLITDEARAMVRDAALMADKRALPLTGVGRGIRVA